MRSVITTLVLSVILILQSCQSTGSTGLHNRSKTNVYDNYNLGATSSNERTSVRPQPDPEPVKELVQEQATKTVVVRYYLVRKGDTLASISRMTGLSVDEIKRVNYKKSNNLEVGEKIYLPGVKSISADPLKSSSRTVTQRPSSTPKASYTLVRRSSWTSTKVKKNITKMGAVHKITVHHSSESASATNISDKELISRIAKFHRNERKWAAIGYHYIIGRDGRVYEGRPVIYQGAHASGANKNKRTVFNIGKKCVLLCLVEAVCLIYEEYCLA